MGVFALSDRPATANGTVRVCVCVSHEMRHFIAGAASQLRRRRETRRSQCFSEGGLPPELSVLPRRVGCLSVSQPSVFLLRSFLRFTACTEASLGGFTD